jgi:hypothetical protein
MGTEPSKQKLTRSWPAPVEGRCVMDAEARRAVILEMKRRLGFP